MKALRILAALALLVGSPAVAKGDVAPLFASGAPLQVEINGPLRFIAQKAGKFTDPYPATLKVGAETLAITLAARGLTRRNPSVCTNPPLRVEFTAKPPAGSPFQHQKHLKLVVNCRESDQYEQFVLREYAAYRLYNVLTPESLNVRLARVRYLDNGKLLAERWGFFIEDIDNAAKRLGGTELDVPSIPSRALDHADAARYVLFQYMIGNTDWEMKMGPKGTDCCHNSKLVAATKETREAVIPVPYDFDYAGLVDATYAMPANVIPINSVTTRYYWGLCMHNAEVLAAAPTFLAARPALEKTINAVPGLKPKDRDAMLRYLAGFFETIATPELIQAKMFKTCR